MLVYFSSRKICASIQVWVKDTPKLKVLGQQSLFLQ